MEKINNFVISKDIFSAEEYLKEGKPAVILTETLYGILADALNREAVEYVYKLKKRHPKKPFIILIPNVEKLELFNIKPNDIEKKLLNYKGLSVVLDTDNKNLEYLHRGTKSLAFRIPSKKNLLELLNKINIPLIAPSCNPEGLPPAKNIKEAVNYFGDSIPIYIDEGEVPNNKPSTIVKVKDGNIDFLRVGNISPEEILKYLKKGS